ncbi:hypothetical protein M8C21_030472 [Ambrosia artemisiifolia]|uniref:DM2 domain-containing protein n=1 Tax=Ambrosia artemisiifolia TaxID=4212 RepID=A0AAD5GIN6_AMBAR|nr:hypothetical protein M8C21_030472 [Ambrosia artemisiifolia]
MNEAKAMVLHYARFNGLTGTFFKMVEVIFDDKLTDLFGKEGADFSQIPTLLPLLAKHLLPED